MKNNQLILQNFQQLDLYNMNEEKIIEIKNQLVENVKISKLEQEVKKAILKLSRVGPPSFMADAVYIALDNQQRLDIIYLLLDNFELFKQQTKNFKKDKNNCNDNFEYIFNYLLHTQDLLKTIYKYTEFQYNEKVENEKILMENKQKLLETETN